MIYDCSRIKSWRDYFNFFDDFQFSLNLPLTAETFFCLISSFFVIHCLGRKLMWFKQH